MNFDYICMPIVIKESKNLFTRIPKLNIDKSFNTEILSIENYFRHEDKIFSINKNGITCSVQIEEIASD